MDGYTLTGKPEKRWEPSGRATPLVLAALPSKKPTRAAARVGTAAAGLCTPLTDRTLRDWTRAIV